MASGTNKNHWSRLGMLVIYHFVGGSITIGTFSWIGLNQIAAGLFHMLVMLGLLLYIMRLFRCPFCEKNLGMHNWFYSNGLWAYKKCQHCGEHLP